MSAEGVGFLDSVFERAPKIHNMVWFVSIYHHLFGILEIWDFVKPVVGEHFSLVTF